jgi:LysR family transcriptional regulator, salicylic acid-responsive activator of bsdBCD
VNLRQLTYFRAVVERGSLAAAADVLHVAQPNLSVAIRQLEAEWGVSLFDRVGRGLVLTDTGQVLFERAAQLLGGAAAVDQEMRAIGRGASARVRVGFTAVSIDQITKMVEAMQAKGQAVSFSLHQGEPKLLETLVETRELDFAVTPLPVSNPALHIQPMGSLELKLLARNDDARWKIGAPIKLKQLYNIPLILPKRSAGIGVFEKVNAALAAANVSGYVLADCTDMATIQALVMARVGVGLIPMREASLPPFDLVAYKIDNAPPLEQLALIYPRGRRLLPAVQAAMDLCRGHVAGADDTADAR